MVKYFQKLGKSLMLPVACLPVCGILMGIGYALCPATMQGGEITGFLNLLGFFLVKAGGAGVMRPSKTSVQVVVGTKVHFPTDVLIGAVMGIVLAIICAVGINRIFLPKGGCT